MLCISLFSKYISFDIRYVKCSFPATSNPSASLRSIHLLSWDSIEIPARRYRRVPERRVASPTLEAFPGAVKRSLFPSIRLFAHFTFFLPSAFALPPTFPSFTLPFIVLLLTFIRPLFHLSSVSLYSVVELRIRRHVEHRKFTKPTRKYTITFAFMTLDSQGTDLFSFCSLPFPFALFPLSVHLSTEGSGKTGPSSGTS